MICTCPVEAAIHHPSCVAGELVGDVDPFVMGKDQIEAAQIANRMNTERQPAAERHRFGPLAAIQERFGRRP